MSGFDNSNFDAFLKKQYVPQAVEVMAFEEHPLLAMVKKDTSFGGGSGNGTWEMTVATEHPQGGAATFAQALANAATAYTRGKRFALTTVDIYQLAEVAGKTIRATDNNKKAQLNALTEAVDGTMKALGRKLAVQLYRPGWGAIGISGTAAGAGTTIQLDPIQDAVNFAEGQIVVASASLNAALLRSAGASLIVSAVDYSTGIVTFTTAINAIAALAVGDYLFVKSDRENSATPTRLCIAGVGDWVPDTVPVALESFFGADRSGNSRLYGSLIDVSGLSIREGITKGLQAVRAYGGRPDYLFMNTYDYGQLLLEIQTTGQFQMTEVSAGTGGALVFPAVKLYTQFGTVTVVDDPECPIHRGYLLRLKDWVMGSLGPCPGLLEMGTGATKTIAVYNADALQVRCGGYVQVYCLRPGHQAGLKFA